MSGNEPAIANNILPFSRDAEFYAHRGDVRRLTGRFEQAIPFYHKAIALAPDNASYSIQLAESMMELGYLIEAARILRRKINEGCTLPKLYYNLALVYMSLDETASAFKMLLRFMRGSDPGDSKDIGKQLMDEITAILSEHRQYSARNKLIIGCERAMNDGNYLRAEMLIRRMAHSHALKSEGAALNARLQTLKGNARVAVSDAISIIAMQAPDPLKLCCAATILMLAKGCDERENARRTMDMAVAVSETYADILRLQDYSLRLPGMDQALLEIGWKLKELNCSDIETDAITQYAKCRLDDKAHSGLIGRLDQLRAIAPDNAQLRLIAMYTKAGEVPLWLLNPLLALDFCFNLMFADNAEGTANHDIAPEHARLTCELALNSRYSSDTQRDRVLEWLADKDMSQWGGLLADAVGNEWLSDRQRLTALEALRDGGYQPLPRYVYFKYMLMRTRSRPRDNEVRAAALKIPALSVAIHHLHGKYSGSLSGLMELYMRCGRLERWQHRPAVLGTALAAAYMVSDMAIDVRAVCRRYARRYGLSSREVIQCANELLTADRLHHHSARRQPPSAGN